MNNDFTVLRRKIFRQVLLIIVLTLVFGGLFMAVFVDGLFQDAFAYGFVGFVQSLLRIDYESAIVLYQRIFQSNKTLWVFAGMLVLLCVIFYIAMNRFTKYFNQIRVGVGQLLDDTDTPISLGSDLVFMEAELNKVKTTLRIRKDAMEKSEQQKNDLVVYLAHDIKTPLTSVIGYLSLLSEAPDMPLEQRAKYTAITLEKAYRLEALINEFFDITRFNLQNPVLEKETLDLSLLLAQMADEFYPILEQKGLHITIDCPPQLMLEADSDKLARVFNNILKNAVAYSYPQSTVAIRAEQTQEGKIAISFTNKGREIPAHKLDKIFDKFYRADEARSTDSGGAGLGLAIAKRITELHGGSITAQSSPEHTVFTVLLPS